MDKDNEFMDDPIFKSLKKFAATSDGSPELPSDIAYTFRNAGIRSTRQKVVRRSVFTIITASVVLPSLSFAHVLPTPIDNVVKSVVHLVATPVRVISNVINDPAPAPAPSLTTTPEQTTPTTAPTPSPTPTADPAPTTPTPVQTQTSAPAQPKPTPSKTHEEKHSETPKPVTTKPAIPSAGDDGEEGGEEGGEHETAVKLPSTSTLPTQPKPAPTIAGGGKRESRSEVKAPESEGDDD